MFHCSQEDIEKTTKEATQQSVDWMLRQAQGRPGRCISHGGIPVKKRNALSAACQPGRFLPASERPGPVSASLLGNLRQFFLDKLNRCYTFCINQFTRSGWINSQIFNILSALQVNTQSKNAAPPYFIFFTSLTKKRSGLCPHKKNSLLTSLALRRDKRCSERYASESRIFDSWAVP